MRHYGFLASRNKSVELNKAKEYFGLKIWEKKKVTWEEISIKKLQIHPNKCRSCGEIAMIIIETLAPLRGPPVMKPNYDF